MAFIDRVRRALPDAGLFGYRDRALDTRLGTLQLRIPKLRQGSYFPAFLEPRRTSEKALVTVIHAYSGASRPGIPI